VFVCKLRAPETGALPEPSAYPTLRY